MKKLVKIFLVSVFTCFSFYYTDQIVNYFKMRDPLMKKINDISDEEEVFVVNGTLSNKTMLVGSSGFVVDLDASYEKMKSLDIFNENLLEYISIKPTITKKDNLDKLIVGKNTNFKEISLVFVIDNIDLFQQVMYILKEREVTATIFMDGALIESNLDLINKLLDEVNSNLGFYGYNNNYDDISIIYMKNFFDNTFYTKYCLYVNNRFLSSCIRNKISTINPIFVSRNLYSFIKNNKSNGYIYGIKINKVNIKELNTMLIYLKQKGYNILNIEELLKE